MSRMVRPNAVGPDVEVRGQTVVLIRDGLNEYSDEAAARGIAILADAGLADPRPDAWYSLRSLLDALDAIGERVGDDALRHLGTTIPEGVEWPPDVDSVRRGFATVNDAYQLNHRGGDIGSYEFVATGDREHHVVCENPYPCPFDKGIIEGVLRAFGYQFRYPPMVFIQETSDHCRAEGGPRCEYRVTW